MATRIDDRSDKGDHELVCGALRLDTRTESVFRRSYGVRLGRQEYVVLEALMSANGAVVSQPELLAIMAPGTDERHVSRLRSVIGRLRRKLGSARLIETIGSEGYRINPLR